MSELVVNILKQGKRTNHSHDVIQ